MVEYRLFCFWQPSRTYDISSFRENFQMAVSVSASVAVILFASFFSSVVEGFGHGHDSGYGGGGKGSGTACIVKVRLGVGTFRWKEVSQPQRTFQILSLGLLLRLPLLQM